MATKTTKNKEYNVDKMEEVQENIPEVTIAELLKQIEELKKQVAEQKTVNAQTDTFSEKMIKFISLVSGSVMLKGSNTKPYEIEGQYNSRSFTESEARVIVSQMGGYMRKGFVFIDDPVFVREVGLSDAYRTMLTPEQLKTIFNKKPETIISIFENASDGQRQIILDMVRTKLSNKETVDGNVLLALSNLSGKDLLHNMSDDDE